MSQSTTQSIFSSSRQWQLQAALVRQGVFTFNYSATIVHCASSINGIHLKFNKTQEVIFSFQEM